MSSLGCAGRARAVGVCDRWLSTCFVLSRRSRANSLGVRVAVVGRLGERLGDDEIEHRGDRRVDRARRRRHQVEDLEHDRGHVLAGERRLAGEHLVEDHAEREDVRARLGALARDLLGRHVARRAEHDAGLRAAPRPSACARCRSR